MDSEENETSGKYPELNTILAQNPTIPVRTLAEQLGVSTGTAHKLKKEWEAAQKASKPPKEPLRLPTIKAEKFTEREANDKRESLIAALESDFEYLDQYLINRRKAAALAKGEKEWNDQEIWSDMDDKDLQKLASVMLRGAKHSPAMAVVVNATIESADYITVGSVMAPRIQETVQVLRETRTPRRRRGER